MIDHPAPTCPEGVNQCDIDCPHYGRDCDGDEVVYVTGGVGDDCEDDDSRDMAEERRLMDIDDSHYADDCEDNDETD